MRTYSILVSLVCLLYVALATANAMTAIPWCDEAWFANTAFTWLHKGYPGTAVLTSFGWGPPMFLPHIERYTYWTMPLHTVALTAWSRVFGFGLLSLREMSVFFGLLGIASLGVLVRKLGGDRWAALLAI